MKHYKNYQKDEIKELEEELRRLQIKYQNTRPSDVATRRNLEEVMANLESAISAKRDLNRLEKYAFCVALLFLLGGLIAISIMVQYYKGLFFFGAVSAVLWVGAYAFLHKALFPKMFEEAREQINEVFEHDNNRD